MRKLCCFDTSLQSLRTRLAGLRYLIIDEISMVSAATLQHVNGRMQEGLGNQHPYGGVSVIFVGDFFQLPPGAFVRSVVIT